MNNFEGFTELTEYFKEITSEMDNVTDILEIGAQDLVKDLLKLPNRFVTGYNEERYIYTGVIL